MKAFLSYPLIGLFLLIVFFSGNYESFATHISEPILTIQNTEFFLGQDVTISGWVKYDEQATSDVLLNVKVIDPKNNLVIDQFVTSDSTGSFELSFGLPQDGFVGNYTLDITSMCREEHRNICTHKSTQAVLSVFGKTNVEIIIPQWIKNNADWWSQGLIGDDDFILALEYLIQEKIMVVPPSEPSSESQLPFVPNWIKDTAGWWAQGKVSDSDFVNGIQYMISNGYIKV